VTQNYLSSNVQGAGRLFFFGVEFVDNTETIPTSDHGKQYAFGGVG
jgi:hypothetical protein